MAASIIMWNDACNSLRCFGMSVWLNLCRTSSDDAKNNAEKRSRNRESLVQRVRLSLKCASSAYVMGFRSMVQSHCEPDAAHDDTFNLPCSGMLHVVLRRSPPQTS